MTFVPPTLGLPRMGVREGSTERATRAEADIDLYVSRDPDLTKLAPLAVAAADKSLGRGGTDTLDDLAPVTDAAPWRPNPAPDH